MKKNKKHHPTLNDYVIKKIDMALLGGMYGGAALIIGMYLMFFASAKVRTALLNQASSHPKLSFYSGLIIVIIDYILLVLLAKKVEVKQKK